MTKFSYPIFISFDMDLPLRRKKIAEYYKLDEFDASVVAAATKVSADPVLVQENEWPQISEERQAVVTELSECMKKVGSYKLPLYEGEVVEKELVTYLKEPFRNFRENIAVWMRKTNLGTVYIFANIYGVDSTNGKISIVQYEPVYRIDHYAAMQFNSIASDLLLSFVQGLVGLLGNYAGTAILDKIFSTSQGLDYKQLLDDIRAILREELIDIALEQEYGKAVDGVINQMISYYKNRKESGQGSKQELYNYVLDKQSEVNAVIGMLKREKFKKQGVSLFIAAASLDLSLYQELALMDPNVTDPMKSSNINALKEQAKRYADHANGVLDSIQQEKLKERLDKISGIDSATNDAPVSPLTLYFYFDSEVQIGSVYHSKDRNKVENDRNNRINRVTKEKTEQLNEALKSFREAVNLWSKLLNKPLGK